MVLQERGGDSPLKMPCELPRESRFPAGLTLLVLAWLRPHPPIGQLREAPLTFDPVVRWSEGREAGGEVMGFRP